jgi:hypothetical protein
LNSIDSTFPDFVDNRLNRKPDASSGALVQNAAWSTGEATRLSTTVFTDPVAVTEEWVVTLSTAAYLGSAVEHFHVFLGTSTKGTTTIGEPVETASENVQTWFTSSGAAATSSSTDAESSLRRAEWEVLKLTSYMNLLLRPLVRENFSRLVAAIEEDAEPVTISIASVRFALKFLGQVESQVTPQFSLTEDGNIYLQWFDGENALVGITFKADGRAIWSASQLDPTTGRMADAGERPWGALATLLPSAAPWAFRGSTDDKPRRSAAG